MTEVKDKLVTAESLKNAYDTLNNKSYEKLDVVYNKTNNSLVFQNTPELPDNVYVDKTLTESGNAADAKVTGDAITELKNETSGLKGDLSQLSEEIANVADEVDALAALSECGIITPAYQDGTFYTDEDGEIYTL